MFHLKISVSAIWLQDCKHYESKKEGKDRKSIQSSTTPDSGK